MNNRTWIYTGNISGFTRIKDITGKMIISEIELYDIDDRSKAPVLLHVSPALMEYIMDVEDNDDEERYMRKEFVYDDTLFIREIRILNRANKVCKIIRERDMFNRIAEIFGPVARVTNENQEALKPDAASLLVVGPETWRQAQWS